MITELRDKIIEASLELFEKEGFHGATVSQIVAKAGTSKGGFYHHFQSKDELLFVIHDTFITYVLEKATKPELIQLTPIARLQTIIHDFVNVFSLYKSHIAVFYREAIYLKPVYEKQINEKRHRFKQIIFDVVSAGKKDGSFRSNLSVDMAVMAILGMVNWIYMWYKPDGIKTIDDIATIYNEFITRALTAYPNKDNDGDS